MHKAHQVRTTFGSWDVEKVHAVVARSTFPSQNAQSTPGSDHFWKLRCRKSARRCGAKHISKSKCTKHTSFGPLLLVEMSKKCTPLWRAAHFQVKMHKAHQVRTTFGSWDVEKCTPLWREAHFEVKMYKTHQLRTTFTSWDVEKVHAVVARSTFRNQKCKKNLDSEHFWKLRCWKSARRCGAKHISKSKCTKHTTFRLLLEVEMLKKRTPLWHEAPFEVKMYKTHHVQTTFGSWDVEKCAKHISKSKCSKHHMLGPPLKVQMWFCVVGARDSAPCQKCAKREGFVAFPKTMAGVGDLQRICKGAFRVAGAVQETCSSDFLRWAAFWSIRSVGLLRCFCVAGAALRMTWHQFFVAGAIL